MQFRMGFTNQDGNETAETRSDEPEFLIALCVHPGYGVFSLVATFRNREITESPLGCTHPKPAESKGADTLGDQELSQAEVGATLFI